MFTGIVSEIGRVTSAKRRAGSLVFTVSAPRTAPELCDGASVAVNGVCQTVTFAGKGQFSFEAVPETLSKTNLALLGEGSPVNLEPALRLGDRISGHLVSGHVDSTGVVRKRRTVGHNNLDFAIQVPEHLVRFIREKGSISLDGVSLTVKSLRGPLVEVTVIPYTLKNTIVAYWRVGTLINVEVDQLAKYLSPGFETKEGGMA